VRERTKYVIRAVLGSLVGITVTWFGSFYVARKLGFIQEKPALFHAVMLTVFVGLAIYNIAAMANRADRNGST
jgi:hypothetical protein